MGKKIKGKRQFSEKKYESVISSDEEQYETFDANNDSGDEQDKFFGKDKIFLNENDDDDEDDDEEQAEELFPLNEDSDDEDDKYLDSVLSAQLKKDEMNSDIDEDEEDDIPSANAWGKQKQLYYSTDYTDRDKKRLRKEEEEFAIAEEEDAIEAQKRLLEEISEADLGLDLLEASEANQISNVIATDEDDISVGAAEKISVDISSLNDKEKLNLIKKTSPELLPLINDFTDCLNETKKLELIINLAKKSMYKTIENTSAYKLIETKYHLSLRYAMLISFYLMQKIEKKAYKTHPVVKSLLVFKKLLKQTDELIKVNELDEEMNAILDKIKRNEKLVFNTSEYEDIKIVKEKQVRFSSNIEQQDDDDDEQANDEDEQIDEDNEDDERRAITYEMAKNKGLTQKKRKELRNPRVKHKLKYKRALVRRRGQVREPRKELSKYGGELSGIRSTTVKSVKFK